MDSGQFSIKSYVLRSGRTSRAQHRALDNLSGVYGIPFAETALDFNAVFGNSNPITIEIGFGMGGAMTEIAAANPDKNYIGIEVFQAGVGRALMAIEKLRLGNVRIIRHDAVAVLKNMIPDNSIDAFHIFFPDPWLKKRHKKRRLVQYPFTRALASKLKSGSYLYMVSDCADYCNFALLELGKTETLQNAYPGFAPRQRWRPVTKFEQKAAISGSVVKELFFVKV
ncbi:MAG: tRNA (guanosine(46)-N7)-methyltransferase TrmB [Spirochaetaceae bacterium]|jgi:tRNA (guanine-N7-)-methyltransferase|nr:tRNA (guanosine(46)-N7)-methyltransferase TrmB [Spirochaetaceae bacterium]